MEDVDVNELDSDVADFFNSELGNDISSLNKLDEILKRLREYENVLKNEINPQTSESGNSKRISSCAEDVLCQIDDLDKKCEELQQQGRKELDKLSPSKEHFIQQIKQLKGAECLYNYLQWILKIESENCSIEESLKNGYNDRTVDLYCKIKQYWEQLRTSECKNLVEYLQKTMLYWYDILLQKFGCEFQKVLSNMHWPSSTSIKLSLPPILSNDSLTKFKQLFLILCRVALPDVYLKTLDVKEGIDDSNIILPLQLMLQPLQKRFHFHFMSKKPTNRIDKPEWYLTQILSWITDNSPFLEKNVDPILAKENLSDFNSQVHFMRGLSLLAMSRLRCDLPALLEDDTLLSHTIDETLLFSQELLQQGYPTDFPSVVQVLSSEPCFTRWRSLEHQSAIEKTDKILSFDTAWKSRYQDESDLDEWHVPESAELFITLLLTMTERYSNVTDRASQVFFLELQLELLDDFRLRLHQMSQCEMQEAIQANYCGIMNAVHYITNILEEWNNLPFFLQLYVYKKKKDACASLLKESEKPLSNLSRRELKSVLSVQEEVVEKSVFDDVIGLFEHMQKDMLHTMCDRVMLDVKAKSRPYRKEKWFCMQVPVDKKLMEVSSVSLPMLQVINSSLHELEELLAKPLFTKMWQQIAAELNVFLYEEVILQNNFSEGGAVQLNFDMTRNLFPIFGSYSMKPENYFRLIRDSCILLNLSSAPAMLLRETLKHQEGLDSKCSALEELGVFSLSSTQTLLVLSLRNYAVL